MGDSVAHLGSAWGAATLDATLRGRVAGFGEYFALAEPAGAGWRPVSPLLTDVAAVREQVAGTRRAIADARRMEPDRILLKSAASAWHLAIAARLISPVIGAAAHCSAVPVLTPPRLYWRPGAGHGLKLAAARLTWVDAHTPRRAAELIVGSLLDTVFAPLHQTLRAAAALSPGVMWGNLASAAHGAVTVMAGTRPVYRASCQALIGTLLEMGPLHDSATVAGGRFRRRNCCLFYRVPGSGLCGDCVLSHPPTD
ncbi:(2Fe-2S)-binding protein [Mycobacterium sp. SMC-4]|uniref:(2Fe-2S)-binding protein n=1 Tax=Mycobacterium sp. SMC-4 TaxID=2857059 RepID=UPI003CFD065B